MKDKILVQHCTIVSNGKTLAHLTDNDYGECEKMAETYNFCIGVDLAKFIEETGCYTLKEWLGKKGNF